MTDNRTTELLDGLRNVGNLHEFAELFGFNWYDESDWTWHDVAVKMADDLEQRIADLEKERDWWRDEMTTAYQEEFDGLGKLEYTPDGERPGLMVMAAIQGSRIYENDLENRVADLEQLIKEMYCSWCICHNHPGTYQTIESMELSAFKTRMEELGIGDAE